MLTNSARFSRNTARMVVTSLDPENARMSGHLIVCFAHTLANRLENKDSVEPCINLLTALSPAMCERVARAPNKPLECLVALGETVRNGNLAGCKPGGDRNNYVQRLVLETCLGELFGQLGACERIAGTRVPLTYSMHATRLLTLFLITLPIVLVDQPGGQFFTIPAVVFVTWAFSGIDEVAHLIEDPFQGQPFSLQLEPICTKIQKDILEQILPRIEIPRAAEISNSAGESE
jgi:predicted membrane chloride channel (bestrophin family)